MAAVDDYDFTVGDAGASHTTNNEAGQIRVGGYMCFKGDRPAKVTDVSTSKTGKHGSAKCNFTAVDIFNGKKYQDIAPSTQTVLVPNVVRKEYTLVDISPDEFTTLMDEDGTTREDIKLPEWPDNYGREIKLKFEEGKQLIVIVWSAMGHDQIMSDREDAEAAKA